MRKLNVADELMRGPAHDSALICTYSLDPGFVEDQLLAGRGALAERANVAIATDAEVYARLGTSAQPTPRMLNRRYVVQEIPASGVFHAKLALLASADRGKLLVGSANLTRAGVAENAELMVDFGYGPGSVAAPRAITGAYRFLERIAQRVAGTTFAERVAEVGRGAPWLTGGPQDAAPFVHNLDRPLLEQVAEMVGGERVDEFLTVSPYFDRGLHALHTACDLLRPRLVTVVTQEAITTLPIQAVEQWERRRPGVRLGVKLAEFQNDDRHRSLHAKLHVARIGKRCVCLIGSANCTAAALTSTARTGNIECGVLVHCLAASAIEGLFPPSFVELRDVDGIRGLRTNSSGPRPRRVRHVVALDYARLDTETGELICRIRGHRSLGREPVHLRLMLPRGDPLGEVGLPRGEWPVDDPGVVTLALDPGLAATVRTAPALARIERAGVTASASRWIECVAPAPLAPAGGGWAGEAGDGSAEALESMLSQPVDAAGKRRMARVLGECRVPLGSQSRNNGSVGRGHVRSGRRDRYAPGEPVTLREAVQRFAARHLRRLGRLVDSHERESRAEFWSVAWLVIRVLRWHWGQIAAELEDEPVIEASEWKAFRRGGDLLLRKYGELSRLLARAHDCRLAAECQAGRAAIVAMHDDLMVDIRRTRRWAETVCSVRTGSDRVVPAQFFPGDCLHDANWGPMVARLDGDVDAVRDAGGS